MADKGKNNRRQIEAHDSLHGTVLSVDSMEELDFCNWLCEAAELSIINDFVYQPATFQLFDAETYTAVDGKQRCLFRDHVYSPDFVITFNPDQLDLAKEFKTNQSQLSGECSAWIDTKGTFNLNSRSFQTDRKWVWQKYGVYICEVIPKKFFGKFGVPEKSMFSEKTKKPRKIFKGFKSIKHAFNL